MEKVLSFFKNLSPTTWIIILIVVLLIIALVIYINNKQKPKDGINANNTLAENLNNSQPRNIFPLQYGSKGEETKNVQKYLNSKGENLIVDGIWGPLTDKSVLKVLKVNSITEDLYKTLI